MKRLEQLLVCDWTVSKSHKGCSKLLLWWTTVSLQQLKMLFLATIVSF